MLRSVHRLNDIRWYWPPTKPTAVNTRFGASAAAPPCRGEVGRSFWAGRPADMARLVRRLRLRRGAPRSQSLNVMRNAVSSNGIRG